MNLSQSEEVPSLLLLLLLFITGDYSSSYHRHSLRPQTNIIYAIGDYFRLTYHQLV